MSMLVVCYTATYVWSLNLSPLFAMQEYIVFIHNVKCKVIPVGHFPNITDPLRRHFKEAPRTIIIGVIACLLGS